MAETQINIQQLIDEWGAFYRPEGQTARDIKTQLLVEDDISQYFPAIPHEGSHFRSVYATIDEVLQAFSIPFTPKSTMTFKPWEQRLGEFKIDAMIYPDKLWPSYLGFLATKSQQDRSQWPFIRWAIQEMLLPKAQEDFILEVAYKGWQYNGYAAVPTVNAITFVRELDSANVNNPLPANASMDGIQVQIAKMVADNRANVITMGAWNADPATFCGQIESFAQQIDSPLRRKIDFLFMSEVNYNKYIDGRRAKYNLYWQQEADLELIDKTNIRVKKSESMLGSDQVWGTPAMNRVKPVKTGFNSMFDLQKFDRGVKNLKNYEWVLTFHIPEFVVTSEHDTTIDAADYS